MEIVLDVMSSKITNLLHALFIVGIIFTITGWFFDRAKSFNFLLSWISPEYVFAQQALADLKKDQKIALTKNHEGFEVLLKKWPDLSEKESVVYIGRSVAYMSFGPEMSSDIEIIAFDKDQNEIKNRWAMSNANATFESIIDKKLFIIGTILFWFGIVISVVSHILSSSNNS